METLLKIGDAAKARDMVNDMLAKKERIMGFGHRVYKTEDPRATILRRHSEALGKRTGDSRWYDISREVEKTMREDKPDLYPNVDFYSASVYHMLGIPIDQFTPSSRSAGWPAGPPSCSSSTRTTASSGRSPSTSGRRASSTSPSTSADIKDKRKKRDT